MPWEPFERQTGAVVGSPRCEVCDTPLGGRQKFACSDACRAIRWRLRQQSSRQHRDEELRVLALAVRQAAEALERRLADPM
jgi:hypothetical protein